MGQHLEAEFGQSSPTSVNLYPKIIEPPRQQYMEVGDCSSKIINPADSPKYDFRTILPHVWNSSNWLHTNRFYEWFYECHAALEQRFLAYMRPRDDIIL